MKWHTHVVEYVYVWLAGVFVFRLCSGGSFSERGKNLFLLFTSMMMALGIMETTLQITGTTKTYLENVNGEYTSPYSSLDRTWYHTWSSTTHEHRLKKPEYDYWRPTNVLGFGDSTWSFPKKTTEKRLMTLGDSFTEGDGAPYDSSYVALLKQKLLAAGDTFYVMNAGVCGSDPFDNYINLRDRLLVYSPQVIVQVLASNDLTTDILLRGGMERFKEDGTQQYKSAPWWEPVYAFSYISRLFFKKAGYNELLRKGGLTAAEEKELNAQLSALFKTYAWLCRQNQIKLIVVLRPDRGELAVNKYDYDFSAILSGLQADSVKVIDLLPAYQSYMQKNHSQSTAYFWRYDGHHNAAGYEMMAQSIFENISPLLRDTSMVP